MQNALAHIRSKTDIQPLFGIILGSGLGVLAEEVENAVRIPYAELEGMPISNVSSHSSELVLGTISGVPVALFSGRIHFYEEGDPAVMRPAIELMNGLGCECMIATNAAGSLREELGVGEVMLISDHLNWSGRNPLIGESDDSRFVGLAEAYDPELQTEMKSAAASFDYDLQSGVYTWFSGPSFETPAEIRATRILGGDVVGMSTVPEVILARYYGLKVAAFSSITNLAAGMVAGEISHDETKEMAPLAAQKIIRILKVFFERRAANG